MSENWRVVERHPDYMVSDDGKVMGKYGRLLKPAIVNGRERVRLDDEQIFVHRLVAEAFIENPFCLCVVNHKDGNPKNNNAWNLEWCTQKQNMIHARDVLGSFDNRKQAVKCVEKNVVYDSIESASRAVSGNIDAIWRCIRGYRKTHKGFHWETASYERTDTKENRIDEYINETNAGIKNMVDVPLSISQKIMQEIFRKGYDIDSVSKALGCCYETASKKISNPELLRIKDIRVIEENFGFSNHEIFNAFINQDRREQTHAESKTPDGE